MNTLAAVSLLAQNAAPFYRTLVAFLGQQLGLPANLHDEQAHTARLDLLTTGQAQLGFICGLPYSQLADQSEPPIELLAAPVMAEARYDDRAVYFSDVIVRSDSPFASFANLRGCAWAYNEPGSFSGYAATQAHLARLGETRGFFGRAIASGAHQRSVQLVVEGLADASAIDSVVLAYELKCRPELAGQLRSLAALGPSPMPPVVASMALGADMRAALRELLLTMHERADGRAVLAQGLLARFAPVSDADYDDIRRTARAGNNVPLAPEQVHEVS
jgi:phosphonate transport system substrate-binding protein